MFIKVKKDTTVWNLMAIFITPIISTSASAYVNVMMPYLLQDKDYFNLSFDKMGQQTGQILFWAFMCSTLVTPFFGYLYDIIGRFWFIVPSCFILSLQVAIIPYSSPHFWLLCVFRASVSSINNLLQSNPLVMDYVKNESRGLVMSYATVGFVLGEMLMVLIFESTRDLTILQQYWMPGLIIGLVSTVLIFLVRDPKIKDPNPDVSSDSDTSIELDNYSTNYENPNVPLAPGVWSKVKNLTLVAKHECRRDPKYLYVFMCLFVSRLIGVLFSVYLQLWVMNFFKTGVIATKEQSDQLYMSIILGSLVTIVFVAPIFGFISDKAD